MLKDKILINNHVDQSKIINLLLLRSATEWLEKQNWISSPYGGDNYLEDIIFRIKLLSGQEWSSVFQDGENSYSEEQIKEYFELLKTIDPSIRIFCDNVQNKNT